MGKFTLGCEGLDLMKIQLSLKNASFNPKWFPAVIIRFNFPKCTCLVFWNGKVISTGAKDELSLKLGSKKCASLIKKLGFAVEFNNFKVCNIVANIDLGKVIWLEGIQWKDPCNVQYEPEIFPALIHWNLTTNHTYLVFHTGKIVITGVRSWESMVSNFKNYFEKIIKPNFKDKPKTPSIASVYEFLKT